MSRIEEALKRAAAEPRHDRQGIDPPEHRTVATEAPFDLAQYHSETQYHSEKAEERSPLPDAFIPLQRAHGLNGRVAFGAPRRTASAVPHIEMALAADSKLNDQHQALARALNRAHTANGTRTVLVTSATRDDGKSRTAVELALVLARTSGRVLLIDADIRQPSLHEVLGIGNDVGLSNVLRGETLVAPLAEVSPAVCVLPAGRADIDPLPLLSSDQMNSLLEQGAAAFDWILLDTAAMGGSPDTLALARRYPAVAFVIGGETPFRNAAALLAKLERSWLIGTLLRGRPEARDPRD